MTDAHLDHLYPHLVGERHLAMVGVIKSTDWGGSGRYCASCWWEGWNSQLIRADEAMRIAEWGRVVVACCPRCFVREGPA